MAWVTSANADTYFSGQPSSKATKWSALNATQKTALVEQASNRLDALVFIGDQVDAGASKYTDATPTSAVEPIPLRLYNAVLELAFFYIDNPFDQIILEGEEEDRYSLMPELADLPLPIQNLVYPFMRYAPHNKDLAETEDIKQKTPSGALSYDSREAKESREGAVYHVEDIVEQPISLPQGYAWSEWSALHKRRFTTSGFKEVGLFLACAFAYTPQGESGNIEFRVVKKNAIGETLKVYYNPLTYSMNAGVYSIRSSGRQIFATPVNGYTSIIDEFNAGDTLDIDMRARTNNVRIAVGNPPTGGPNHYLVSGRLEIKAGAGGGYAELPTVLQHVPQTFGEAGQVLKVGDQRDRFVWGAAGGALSWETNHVRYRVLNHDTSSLYYDRFYDDQARVNVTSEEAPLLGVYDFKHRTRSGNPVEGKCLRPHVSGLYLFNGNFNTTRITSQSVTPGGEYVEARIVKWDPVLGFMRRLWSGDAPENWRDRILICNLLENTQTERIPFSLLIPLTANEGIAFRDLSPNAQMDITFVAYRIF